MTQSAPLPPNEQERLAALHALNLLDTSSEERFDHITHLAKTIFAVPIVLISLVDAKRQWFKSCYGLSVQETPREQSFCAYTLLDNLPLIVPNTLEDQRFADHPSVLGEPSIRFYAGYPLHDPQGYILGTLCLIDRIPRQFLTHDLEILAELALMVEREIDPSQVQTSYRFHTLFDDAAIGIVLLNEQGRLLEWNTTFEHFFGDLNEDLQGRSISDLIDFGPHEQMHTTFQALFQQEIPSFRNEYSSVHPGRRRIDIQGTFSLTYDPLSQQAHCIGLVEDITARKEAEQHSKQAMMDLLEHAHSLEEMQKQQRNFVSVVGHEIRTALTGIRGFSELLSSEEVPPADVHEFAENIFQDSLRLVRMINNLLDVERMQEGKAQLYITAFDMVEVLRERIHRARVSTNKHLFELFVDLPEAPIEGDLDKLNQVIANLLSNAVKYSPQGGTITLRCQVEANTIHLQVQDQGIGISPDAIDKIFDAYSRVASEQTRYIHGTGLGLTIVKYIVQMHGGTVWAESGQMQGTTIHVVLPCKRTSKLLNETLAF